MGVMNPDRERQRASVVRFLLFQGCLIAFLGLVGLVAYYLDIAGTRAYPLLVLAGTLFCIVASLRMFYLANDVKNRKD
jgi:hypothetical protein